MFVRQFNRRGLAYEHCIVALAWIGGPPSTFSSIGQGGDNTSLILCGTMLGSHFGSGDTSDRFVEGYSIGITDGL